MFALVTEKDALKLKAQLLVRQLLMTITEAVHEQSKLLNMFAPIGAFGFDDPGAT